MNKFAMQSIDVGKLTRDNNVLQALLLSIITTAAILFWHFHHDFDFWDEGFLWYGVQRVMLGEVPMRDFMAYDPGRYYWSAALMSLWGNNGLLALRTTIAFFQLGALFTGLMLIARSAKKASFTYMLLSLLTLAAWMFPRWKLFDIGLSVFLIAILAFLVERPTYRRYFLTGLCIGLAAVFGRNHGLYGALAGIGTLLWLSYKREDGIHSWKAFGYWSAGIICGYSPILIMAIFIPGFAQAFWEGIRLMFEFGATNLAMPVPWPWLVPFHQLPRKLAIDQILIGIYFIAILVFGLLAMIWIVRKKIKREAVSPVLVACAFLSLPYAHHAFARAASLHLAQGIFPLLIGVLAILAAKKVGRIQWLLAIVLCTTSVWVGYFENPDWYCYRSKQCVATDVAGNTLELDQTTAENVELFKKLVRDFAPNGRSFLATPFRSGAYAIFGRKAPVWEIYATVHREEWFEKSEIQKLKSANPGFVFIFDYALDGKDSLRFKNTHPLTYQYIVNNFDPVVGYTDNSAYKIFKSREFDK